ncbi:response regulator transcription factor [Massilimicrobiota timonensis]|uniref:DNA-binding response regulator n=1 Tax=Massilimicrobiota timonensis TaxID=1776392 RepID=A0A1Y4STG0_9FIRM|nr:response regulator transcription factor [Massilimicrobiota timonensis]OUQ33196.1 DNA-binding response regulator [Massilimicrobiota timonensis]
MKILIVEDEMAIRDLIGMNLTRAGYQCDYAQNGKEGSILIDYHHYDLILLDIMLPFIDGYELMQYIKPQNVPVIFISAKSTVEERVKGLKMGADDYLVKPFSIDELLARVESVLRRYHKSLNEIKVLDITIDLNQRLVIQNGKRIYLTHMEYELLLFLVQNKNIALYRDVLYQKVWNDDKEETRTLDLHIQRLRKKLNWQHAIKTVYRIGYMLEVQQ